MSNDPTGLPQTHERRLLCPDTETGPWLLVFTFAELDYRIECVGFEMRCYQRDTEPERGQLQPPGTRAVPLTSGLLRRLKFDTEKHDAMTGKGVPWIPKVDDDVLEFFGVKRETLGEPAPVTPLRAQDRGPGRPKVYDDDHFREVAAVYAVADKLNKPATAAVQRHFAEKWGEPVTRSQAAKWVYRARNEFGLLEPTEPRRQGGRLRSKENDR